MSHLFALMSLGFSLAPLYKLEDHMSDPRFYLWDIIIGVLFVGLGVGLFIFGDQLLMSLMKRAFRIPEKGKLARVVALVLGVILILVGIVIGLNGFYTLFIIY